MQKKELTGQSGLKSTKLRNILLQLLMVAKQRERKLIDRIAFNKGRILPYWTAPGIVC